jgi:amidophosphoribosyltransferase
MGEKLAAHVLQQFASPSSVADVEHIAPGAHDIDVVIPVPETSRMAALECARVLGVPYREVS